MSLFKGSGVAIVTPFNESGVNYEEFEKLINWQIEMGTDAIIVCGTTGEASTMSDEEKKSAISFTIKTVNKRVPVIAGTGSNSTEKAISMSKWAEEAGADGLLVITPYYNKTTQKGLIEHFTAIASKVKTPIIIYNVPSRTGLNILPKTLEVLSHISNITAVKEASSNINQIAEIKRLCKDNLDIYSGNDSEIIPILALGGAGVISVLANIAPKETHDICNLFFQGKLKEALDLQLKTLPLINALFIETNPIPVKTAMNLMGMNAGELRLPLCEMESKNLTVLKNELENYNLL
ncbi:MAG: 4-hydroxy-tetrahydrodipicolinate synthase [Bacillota bacterium]|nr:4-hydroxy-tetrahydrodipicolinate synthase [Bacillota bacterium]